MSGTRGRRGVLAGALARVSLAGSSAGALAAGAVQYGTSQWEDGYGVAVDGAGNIYTVGSTGGSLAGPSQGPDDAFIIKRSSTGGILWARQFGTAKDDTAYAVAALTDGTSYVVGETYDQQAPFDRYGWIARYSASGDQQWRRQIGTISAGANAVAVDSAGGAVVVGNSDSAAVIIKYQPDGTPVWQKTIKGGYAGATSVAIGANGSVHVAGYIQQSSPDVYDAFLVTYAAADGSLLWQRRPSTPADDFAYAVTTDGLGNVYLAGDTKGSLAAVSSGDTDAFVIKYDQNGNILWGRQFGTPQYDDVWGIRSDAAGNYIVGETEGSLFATNAGHADGWSLALSATGSRLWARQFGTPNYDAVEAVALFGSNVYLSGTTDGPLIGMSNGAYDAFLAVLPK